MGLSGEKLVHSHTEWLSESLPRGTLDTNILWQVSVETEGVEWVTARMWKIDFPENQQFFSACNYKAEKMLWAMLEDARLTRVSIKTPSHKTRNISETGFCFCLQVQPTHLGPIERTSLCLRTPSTEIILIHSSQLGKFHLKKDK
jgi:hypothetical protein